MQIILVLDICFLFCYHSTSFYLFADQINLNIEDNLSSNIITTSHYINWISRGHWHKNNPIGHEIISSPHSYKALLQNKFDPNWSEEEKEAYYKRKQKTTFKVIMEKLIKIKFPQWLWSADWGGSSSLLESIQVILLHKFSILHNCKCIITSTIQLGWDWFLLFRGSKHCIIDPPYSCSWLCWCSLNN